MPNKKFFSTPNVDKSLNNPDNQIKNKQSPTQASTQKLRGSYTPVTTALPTIITTSSTTTTSTKFIIPTTSTTSTTSTSTTTTTTTIPCLVRGTMVLLSNGRHKKIENIKYKDRLMVWNFDDGKFDSARILWIKVPQVHNNHNLIKFSDGSELKTLQTELGHRIFNIEKGMFTYPMTDDTPIGTHTFNEKGETVTLVSKEVVNNEVEYYNIITDKHMNLFTNTILTSCRYNNIYPVVGMKFVKDDRELRPRSEFINISDKYYTGLRLSEQKFKLSEIEKYVEDRIMLDVEELELV